MAERYPVVEHMTLSYNGLFNVTELYKTINSWCKEKGYDRREMRNEEHIYPSGKFIDMELMPFKKVSDYAMFVIRMQITMHDVKEVDVEKNKYKQRLNQGKIDIIFDSFLETDYEGRWEQNPFYFFVRTVFDKFIYRNYTRRFEENLTSDTNHLHTTIKSFLNLYRVNK